MLNLSVQPSYGNWVSVQFKMASMHLKKPVCALPHLRNFLNVAFGTVPRLVFKEDYQTLPLSTPLSSKVYTLIGIDNQKPSFSCTKCCRRGWLTLSTPLSSNVPTLTGVDNQKPVSRTKCSQEGPSASGHQEKGRKTSPPASQQHQPPWQPSDRNLCRASAPPRSWLDRWRWTGNRMQSCRPLWVAAASSLPAVLAPESPFYWNVSLVGLSVWGCFLFFCCSLTN